MGGCQGKAGGARLVTTLKGHTDDVRTASFSPDGQHILTASDDKTCRIWNATTGKLVRMLVGGANKYELISARYSKDGARVVTGSTNGDAHVWNARTGESPGPRVPPRAPRLPAPLAGCSPTRLFVCVALLASALSA